MNAIIREIDHHQPSCQIVRTEFGLMISWWTKWIGGDFDNTTKKEIPRLVWQSHELTQSTAICFTIRPTLIFIRIIAVWIQGIYLDGYINYNVLVYIDVVRKIEKCLILNLKTSNIVRTEIK